MPSLQSNLLTSRDNLGFWMLRSPQTEGECTSRVRSKMFHQNNVNLFFREDSSPKLPKVASNKPCSESQPRGMLPCGQETAPLARAPRTRFRATYFRPLFLDTSESFHHFSLGKGKETNVWVFFPERKWPTHVPSMLNSDAS